MHGSVESAGDGDPKQLGITSHKRLGRRFGLLPTWKRGGKDERHEPSKRGITWHDAPNTAPGEHAHVPPAGSHLGAPEKVPAHASLELRVVTVSAGAFVSGASGAFALQGARRRSARPADQGRAQGSELGSRRRLSGGARKAELGSGPLASSPSQALEHRARLRVLSAPYAGKVPNDRCHGPREAASGGLPNRTQLTPRKRSAETESVADRFNHTLSPRSLHASILVRRRTA